MTGVSINPVASRYAGALFGLARREGVLDAVSRDVESLGLQLANAAVREFLLGSRASEEEQRAGLAKLSADYHTLTKNLLSLLFDKRREQVLEGLPEAFRQRRLRERGAVEGEVATARPLDAADLDALAAGLGKLLDKEVLLKSRLAPDLMAGVRVTVDNRMLDTSVRGRLDELRRKLLDAPLPAGGA
ncbi:MAG TPA: ATP synthase F1 subunit delta [Planctomycetota bacterium]|jgi:F-type H+-transporting ATPase subunit delta|nr:ATP synthase F1 subunit delta [Planctomycetota bacterium]